MSSCFYPEFEYEHDGLRVDAGTGSALALVVDVHPDLITLMDFHSPDPLKMAIQAGMVHPMEEDGEDDLSEIDFGTGEWFEPAVGLVVVREGLRRILENPASVASVVYDPSLRAADVVSDLTAIEQSLAAAAEYETRFRFVVD